MMSGNGNEVISRQTLNIDSFWMTLFYHVHAGGPENDFFLLCITKFKLVKLRLFGIKHYLMKVVN